MSCSNYTSCDFFAQVLYPNALFDFLPPSRNPLTKPFLTTTLKIPFLCNNICGVVTIIRALHAHPYLVPTRIVSQLRFNTTPTYLHQNPVYSSTFRKTTKHFVKPILIPMLSPYQSGGVVALVGGGVGKGVPLRGYVLSLGRFFEF